MNAPVLNAARLGAEMPAPAAPMNARTLMLLTGPIVPTLLSLAWPNVLVMLAQASTGLIETWWVSRLGTDALTGMALVFPGFMMMGMLSAGAVGGGISSAVARALGAGRRADADALVAACAPDQPRRSGLATSALFLVFGRQLYAAMGGRGGSLEAAMPYSNVVFAGNMLVWLMNGLASVIRGTGNMLFPSMVICIGVALLIPLSPLFIFGFGPLPAMGIAGGGVAVVATTALMAAILAWYILRGELDRALARRARCSWAFFADILRVGAVGSLSTLQTTLTVALTTGLVGAAAGPRGGRRLRHRLAARISAHSAGVRRRRAAGRDGRRQHRRRAEPARAAHRHDRGRARLRATEAIGLAAAIWPSAWLNLFGDDPTMVATGTAYLRFVGPTYGFFGLGLALYFASQGAGKLMWPLFAGFARLVIAVGGGWLVLRATGSVTLVFAMLGAALAAYGAIVGVAIWSGVWFRNSKAPGPYARLGLGERATSS